MPTKIDRRMTATHSPRLANKHVKLDVIVLAVTADYVGCMIGGQYVRFTNEQFRVALITE